MSTNARFRSQRQESNPGPLTWDRGFLITKHCIPLSFEMYTLVEEAVSWRSLLSFYKEWLWRDAKAWGLFCLPICTYSHLRYPHSEAGLTQTWGRWGSWPWVLRSVMGQAKDPWPPSSWNLPFRQHLHLQDLGSWWCFTACPHQWHRWGWGPYT